MPYSDSNALNVFLSYASEDSSIADALARALRTAFFDRLDLSMMSEFPSGTKWRDLISDSIAQADILIAIVAGRLKPGNSFTGYEIGQFDSSLRYNPTMSRFPELKRRMFAVLIRRSDTTNEFDGIGMDPAEFCEVRFDPTNLDASLAGMYDPDDDRAPEAVLYKLLGDFEYMIDKIGEGGPRRTTLAHAESKIRFLQEHAKALCRDIIGIMLNREKVGEGVADPPLPLPSLPQDVVDACLRNECIAFVGSGLSARAGLPTWRGFVEGLVEEAVTLGLMSRDTALHQRAAMKVGETNAVADNVTSAFSKNREALLAYYRTACTPADGVQPAIFAELRKIPFAGILTTNYDDLLSQAYAKTNSLQRLTPRDSEQLLAMLSSGDQRFLLKLYGNLDQPDSMIFSPSDYQDLVRSNVAFSRFIEGLFFSRTMLFLGTSLEGLVDYLGAFRFPSGVPRKHYALIAVSGAGWQAMAQTLKRRYNIEVLPYTVSPGFSELDTFLSELAQQTTNITTAISPSAVESGPRLQRVELRNIGPFKHLVLDFKTLWKVLLGDNGVGKSTILKSIAVAIVGSEGRQYAGRLLRAGEALGSVTLVTQKNPSGYVAEIQRVGLEAEVVTRSGRVLETEGWVALAFPPLRATSWVSTRGPQGIGPRYPTAADLLPMLSGEVELTHG